MTKESRPFKIKIYWRHRRLQKNFKVGRPKMDVIKQNNRGDLLAGEKEKKRPPEICPWLNSDIFAKHFGPRSNKSRWYLSILFLFSEGKNAWKTVN